MGALAAGGYGMAGGTAVVTAAGVGLGGASGASVANAYVRNDKSFGFERVAEGDETTVIFANGFLSEGKSGWGGWQEIVEAVPRRDRVSDDMGGQGAQVPDLTCRPVGDATHREGRSSTCISRDEELEQAARSVGCSPHRSRV